MNHNSTLILCGEFKLTRNMIGSGALWGVNTSYASEAIDHQSRHNLQPRAWTIFNRMYTLMRITPREGGVFRVDALLDLVRGAEATDKRDKIYSILGLLDPAIFAGVTPDYSLSVQQAYTDFMKSTINGSARLDQIAFGGMPVEKDWSSWVPDWRKSFERHHAHELLVRDASKAMCAKVRFIEKGKDRTCLECSGFQVDTVDGIAAEPPLDSYATQSSSVSDIYRGQTLKAIERTFGMSDSDCPGEALFRVPWNLSHDTYDHMLSDPERLKLVQSRPFERWESFRKYNKDFCIGGQKFRTFFAQNDEQSLDIASTLRCMHSALRSLDHRALITTRTGYLGLAPVAAHPGDVLAILFGCGWPVVLRPCDDGLYQVIGECYIHGLMHGEILEQHRDGHVSERKFILC